MLLISISFNFSFHAAAKEELFTMILVPLESVQCSKNCAVSFKNIPISSQASASSSSTSFATLEGMSIFQVASCNKPV